MVRTNGFAVGWLRDRLCVLFLPLASACGSGDDGGAEDDDATRPALGAVTLRLSPPSSGQSCTAGAVGTFTYALGSESAPLTDGEEEARVSCSVTTSDDDASFTASIQGVDTNSGIPTSFTFSSETGEASFFHPDTGQLSSGSAMPCVTTASFIIGTDVSADFDCPLLANSESVSAGCSATGSILLSQCR